MKDMRHFKNIDYNIDIEVDETQSGNIVSALDEYIITDDNDREGELIVDILESFLLALCYEGIISEQDFNEPLSRALNTTLQAIGDNYDEE